MVQVLFFSQARSAVGLSEISLTLEEAPDASHLWRCLVDRFPKISTIRETSRLARNCEFLQGNECFSDGDEIAIIPPVSGG